MDEYAKSALFLLQPFSNKGELIAESDGTYLTAFRNRFFSDGFQSHDLRMLQNIQDCYNMLQSGRVEDELTRTTVLLADNGKVDYEKQQEDREAERYVREVMTEAGSCFLASWAKPATAIANTKQQIRQCQCHCSTSVQMELVAYLPVMQSKAYLVKVLPTVLLFTSLTLHQRRERSPLQNNHSPCVTLCQK